MNTLAERAARALRLARDASPILPDPDPAQPGPGDSHDELLNCRLRARLVRQLAAILGVDVADITATADPDRTYGRHPAPLLTYTDPDLTTAPGPRRGRGVGGGDRPGVYRVATAWPR